MLAFECDYNNGAHPALLQKLAETNETPEAGYGMDVYSRSAAEKIRAFCGTPNADVYFLAGGTQTNVVVLSAILEPFEGAVCAESGHIHVHEAGAPEYAGIKTLTLPSHAGKIDAGELEAFVERFYADEAHEHMVFPGAVYLSHPTEYGTLYTKAELEAIAAVSDRFGMRLFLDGARLGYGLMSRTTDVGIADIAALCDVFYIGGTKVGALCGEAVVFPNGTMPKHFANHVKKHGAMLAKGRLIGAQFDALFTEDLYLSLGKHGIDAAERLKTILKEKGYRFFLETDTNQQFVILENEQMRLLSESIRFSEWEPFDKTHTVVRFATSWSTREEDLEALKELL
ncbi:MAG: low specificity L-threonine aldolase [Clostridia bacterium]|nr:low specificity L-threonine aldolase [Clostridia bacterium]